ncbi:PREDICTED: titin-like isoform X3 [Wasmannia auropunctata]|uniref:titin-like isoform X2 n=1 Tax=Wasmannia auropunctata TaxID=64793 RepID=UPI0005F071E2|nr:PREDICTED: titin-like isoform X2 [Wasmannia auropunctata]XP_011689121.1 PREDICTED: titin-like isoform X3 [Wasmannia auropunctata]
MSCNSCDPIKNPCPITCPKVRKDLRDAIAEYPNVTDGIFPRKKNNVEPRLPLNIIQEPTVIPPKKITDDIKEKIPPKKITDDIKEKIDLITEEKLDQEPVTVPKKTVIPTKRIANRDDEKISFVKEDSVVERIAVEPIKEVRIEKSKIIEGKIERAPEAEIKLEPSRELEEHNFEPEEPIEYEEEEDSKTDYEKYIDEELQDSLPAVITREIPEEPRAVREISRNAATLYKKIDRERPVRPPTEREAVTAMPEERARELAREEISARRALEITKQIVPRERAVAEDVCEESCPLKEQKERIMRKLKIRELVVDHYYLKGFSYFEDVCTCSLACMVYTLSRDPFVKSIFASLALFAVGLKLCSELDAWEMPSRVS